MIRFNAFTGSKLHGFEQAYTRCRNASVLVLLDWVMNISLRYTQNWIEEEPPEWPPAVSRIEDDVQSAHACMVKLISRDWKWPYWPDIWPVAPEPDWFNIGKTFIQLDASFGFHPATTPYYGFYPYDADVLTKFGQDGFASRDNLYVYDKAGHPVSSGWSLRSVRYVTPQFPNGPGIVTEGRQEIFIALRYQGKTFGSPQTVSISTEDGGGSILDDFPETIRNQAIPYAPEQFNGGADLIYDGLTESDTYDLPVPSSEHLVPMPDFSVLDEDLLDSDAYGDSTIQGRTNFATFTPA